MTAGLIWNAALNAEITEEAQSARRPQAKFLRVLLICSVFSVLKQPPIQAPLALRSQMARLPVRFLAMLCAAFLPEPKRDSSTACGDHSSREKRDEWEDKNRRTALRMTAQEELRRNK